MRILIVEDDAALQLFVRKGLELEGHTVEAVRDGDEAVEAALLHAPELIVLDLNLPRRDGVDVLRALHGQLATTSRGLPGPGRGRLPPEAVFFS